MYLFTIYLLLFCFILDFTIGKPYNCVKGKNKCVLPCNLSFKEEFSIKKAIILFIVAGLFLTSSIKLLGEGDIGAGILGLVITAVCAFLGYSTIRKVKVSAEVKPPRPQITVQANTKEVPTYSYAEQAIAEEKERLRTEEKTQKIAEKSSRCEYDDKKTETSIESEQISCEDNEQKNTENKFPFNVKISGTTISIQNHSIKDVVHSPKGNEEEAAVKYIYSQHLKRVALILLNYSLIELKII